MTPAERALLRELFRWARKSGIVNVGWRGAPVWRYRWNTKGTYAVSHQRGLRGVAVAIGGPHVDYRCETITQAVDILAALDVIPSRYSSAYRAGWYAGHDATTNAYERGVDLGSVLDQYPAHLESEPAR